MAKGFLVYFVTKGPVWNCHPNGVTVWQVEAQVSVDDGETVRSMVFTFETEQHALKFKRDINFKIEPTVVGEEE